MNIDEASDWQLADALLRRLFPMEDWDSSHLRDTPERFVKMFGQMASTQEFHMTKFSSPSDEMVTVGPIPFYTLCAHHLVPFFGKAWVSYVPQGEIVGLSKLARTVQYMAKGLNVQEEFTANIVDYLQPFLKPLGIGVVVRAEHLCMAMRGVEVAGAITTTSKMTGCYLDPTKQARAEFMRFIDA
jgi:GTP cyclohydrolase I